MARQIDSRDVTDQIYPLTEMQPQDSHVGVLYFDMLSLRARVKV